MTDKKPERLTKLRVERAVLPETGEARLWDRDLSGFCVRIYPTGRRVYAVKYRIAGRQRWLSIGEHSEAMTTDQARELASDALHSARKGVDPAAAKRLRDDLTVGKLIDLYLVDGRKAKPGKREVSWAQDASNLNRHVRPLIGTKLASEVAKSDLTSMVAAIKAGRTAKVEKTKARGKAIVRGGEGTAARSYSTARAMFAWAVSEGLIKPPSPFTVVRQKDLFAARPSVERFLTEEQAAAILTAIAELESAGEVSAQHAAIFRLLLVTGARRAEIAGLRWSEVDLARATLTLPPERSKAGGMTGERRISLSAYAVSILTDLERSRGRSAYVFPATKGKSGHTTAEGKIWRGKVLPKAKLSGVRIHDLRHSFASFALSDGASLALIGKALGHASSRTTERYARLSDDPVRDMAERIGSRFGGGQK